MIRAYTFFFAVFFLASSAFRGAQAEATPPEVFLQPHDEHSSIRYSNPVLLPDGNLVSLDPAWLTLTHHEDDFSDGLEAWIAFKTIRPAERYIRARTHGPRLMDHPSKPGAKVLHIRRPDKHAPDGALWNFPNGFKGALTLRMLLNQGFGGASISFCDRSFKPTDDHAERLAVFTIPIAPNGTLGTGPTLSVDQWHTLEFTWALGEKECRVSLDGKPSLPLDQQNPAGNGISYLHLRSKAGAVDEAGFLVESVSVDTADPVAPPLSGEQQQGFLEQYIPSYYTPPPERGKGLPHKGVGQGHGPSPIG